LVAAVCLSTVVGCKSMREMGDDLKELQLVQKELTKDLGTSDVGVNENTFNGRRSLRISLINSPLKDLPEKDKRLKALEIARTAYRALPSREKLASLSVLFVTQKGVPGFTYTNASDGVTFKPSELDSDA
jgi:hypothetical protein